MHEYALHWDNFHDSLSSGFLGVYRDQVGVDVTLVCEGGLLQAHKLVLTICSPYFRQIFALNPCQHPIVVLKDVNQLVMQDLLSFIYKGEVNVKENHFEQFMKMAKILQIKGLATSDDIENSTSTERRPPKKAAGSSTPSSQKVNISIKPKLGAKRTLDKDDAEPSTSKRPARSAAPKSFEDPLDDEASIKGDEPIQFEAIKCESVDLNVDADAAPFHFDYTEGEAGDETGAGMGFDDDDNESDDDDDFDATNDSAAANTSNAKSDTEKKKVSQWTKKHLLSILKETHIQFPIIEMKELHRIEKLVKTDNDVKNALIIYLLKFRPDDLTLEHGSKLNFTKIIRQDIMHQCTWNPRGGERFGKPNLFDFELITVALKKSWTKDGKWEETIFNEYIRKTMLMNAARDRQFNLRVENKRIRLLALGK